MRLHALACVLLASLAGGCAFFNPSNTPLLTTLDRHVKPETRAAKLALGVVFVPVGFGAAVLDVVVVHPAQAVVLAGGDVHQILWAPSTKQRPAEGEPDAPKDFFVDQAVLPGAKALATPLLFPVCWLGESLFDLHPQTTKEKSE